MRGPPGEEKKVRRSFLRCGSPTERGALAACAVVLCVLVYANFSAGALNKDRGRSSTPDQSYEPFYPDDRRASFGVIYAANGPFVERAYVSARALGPEANATIFTDGPGAADCLRLVRRGRRTAPPGQRLDCRVADEKALSSWGFRAAKLWAFTATPYDKTLYLDADAFPCASFRWLHGELSQALERYEIMATHSSMRRGYAHALHWLNAGIIAFDSRAPAARAVFETWFENYEKMGALTDQRVFNEAVLASAARVMALPPEFNCKSNYKSVRVSWAKRLSPVLYRKVRKDWPCCHADSVGKCVIDHECHFPPLDQRS